MAVVNVAKISHKAVSKGRADGKLMNAKVQSSVGRRGWGAHCGTVFLFPKSTQYRGERF